MMLPMWKKLSSKPGGKWLFSKLLGRMVPYSGSIFPEVLTLEPGYCQVQLRDRKRVRNHLDSIHAVALMNLAELSSGLSVMAGLGEDGRGILTKLNIEYLKKARGTLTSECRVEIPVITERTSFPVHVDVRNEEGDLVCKAEATWLLDRKKQ